MRCAPRPQCTTTAARAPCAPCVCACIAERAAPPPLRPSLGHARPLRQLLPSPLACGCHPPWH
eukprot:1860508-Prymnesium_polylepis.2